MTSTPASQNSGTSANTTTCLGCGRQIPIDSSTCPYCGKPGGGTIQQPQPNINDRTQKKLNLQLQRTKNGCIILGIGILIMTIVSSIIFPPERVYVSVVGSFIGFVVWFISLIGAILIVLGRFAYTKPHQRFAVWGLIFYILGPMILPIGSYIVLYPSLESIIPDIFLWFLVDLMCSAIGGLGLMLLVHKLTTPTGRSILYVGYLLYIVKVNLLPAAEISNIIGGLDIYLIYLLLNLCSGILLFIPYYYAWKRVSYRIAYRTGTITIGPHGERITDTWSNLVVQTRRTKNGCILLAISFLINTVLTIISDYVPGGRYSYTYIVTTLIIFIIMTIVGVIGFIGFILIVLGRNAYTERHQKFVARAVFLYIIGIIISDIIVGTGTMALMSSGGNPNVVVPTVSMMVLIPAFLGVILVGLGQILLVHELTTPLGRDLLYIAYFLAILSEIVWVVAGMGSILYNFIILCNGVFLFIAYYSAYKRVYLGMVYWGLIPAPATSLGTTLQPAYQSSQYPAQSQTGVTPTAGEYSPTQPQPVQPAYQSSQYPAQSQTGVTPTAGEYSPTQPQPVQPAYQSSQYPAQSQTGVTPTASGYTHTQPSTQPVTTYSHKRKYVVIGVVVAILIVTVISVAVWQNPSATNEKELTIQSKDNWVPATYLPGEYRKVYAIDPYSSGENVIQVYVDFMRMSYGYYYVCTKEPYDVSLYEFGNYKYKAIGRETKISAINDIKTIKEKGYDAFFARTIEKIPLNSSLLVGASNGPLDVYLGHPTGYPTGGNSVDMIVSYTGFTKENLQTDLKILVKEEVLHILSSQHQFADTTKNMT